MSRGILRVRVVKARTTHTCVDGGCVIAPGDLHVAVTTSPNHEYGRGDGKWGVSRWCAAHGKRLVNEDLAALLTLTASVPNEETR